MTSLLSLLSIAWVHATVTVTPVSPYTSSADNLYYAASGVASPGGFIGSGFSLLDLTDSTRAPSPSTANIVWIDVSSNTNFSVGSGKQLVVKLLATTQGSTAQPFPIAGAGAASGTPALCSSSNSYCVNPTNGGLIDGKYWMAVYPNKGTVRVGFYPLDICYYVDYVDTGNGTTSNSQYAQGCDSDTGVITSGSTSAAIKISADIFVGDTATPVAIPSPTFTGTSEETKEVTVNFQQTAPTYACDSDLSNLYFPGDTGILFNGTKVSAVRATGGAPVNNILLVGKNGSLPATGSSTYTTNDVVRTAPINIESLVTGFTNTTNGTDNSYDIAFSVQDQSGFIATFLSSCAVNGVQTSEIQTFLQTNKCFIASSAFRNPSAIPVLILRDFRDQFLLKTKIGKRFVHWYYTHSPEAAQWLWYHSQFRIPVIAMLSPFILVALFFVHPEVLVTLLLGTTLLWFVRKKNKVRVA